jgi:site-specific DNA-methyltransferase (adenine-specific)
VALMESKVFHGNCFDILPTLHQRQFDMAFLDPPYNFGLDYGNGTKADSLPPEEYLAQTETLTRESVLRLSPTGSLWFLIPERWADPIGAMLSGLLPRRNRVIWRETFGQYREDRFPSGHRHLFWHVMDPQGSPFYTEDIRVVSQRMLNGDRRAKGPRVPDDVWEFPRLVGNAGERIQGHPCQLPEALLERVIRASTRVGDIILDPTAGTGTTLRVAQRLGRRYVGIEEQAAFVELIERRLAQPLQQELFA